MMNRSGSTGEVLNEVTLSAKRGVRSVMPIRENGTMIANIDLSRFNARGPEQLEHRTWRDMVIDPAVDYLPPEFLLRIGGVGVFPRGDIQAIKGKAKAGKTTVMALLTAGMLANDFTDKLEVFSRPKDNLRILHVDTEQHARSVAWKQKTVYRLIDADPGDPLSNYAVLSLREFSFSDRWDIAKEAIHDFKPDFVLIDGIVDMIADFNDSAESKAFISELMALASRENCAICCVLHENKGKGDNTMRGHLGTELLNKCSETYQVSQLNGIFTVAQTESRNAPAPDFAFTIDSEGLPVMADETPQARGKSSNYLERVQIIRGFFPDQGMRYKDLVAESMERFGVGERTAKNTIKEFLHGDILFKDRNNVYHLKKQDDDLFK